MGGTLALLLVLPLGHFHFLVPRRGRLTPHLLPPNPLPHTKMTGRGQKGLSNTPQHLLRETAGDLCVHSVVQLWLGASGLCLLRHFRLTCD